MSHRTALIVASLVRLPGTLSAACGLCLRLLVLVTAMLVLTTAGLPIATASAALVAGFLAS
jgi:hypothetical protein